MEKRRRPAILVCENEAQLRALIAATLESEKYELFEAVDGDEAVAVALSVRPELILLDMMMPGRTGLEVLEELRRDDHLSDTRVIMLTARTQASDREAAEKAGADVFLAKPFSPLELISRVDELLATGRPRP